MFAHMPIIREIVYGAAARGADFGLLCERAGINPAHLHDSERSLDFEPAFQVWEHAVKFTGDKLLGLHLGESTNPAILGLVGHLMQSSKNILDAFEKVCEFADVATNMFRYSITRRGSECVLSFVPVPLWVKRSPDSARQASEQAMSGTLHVFEILSGEKVMPLRAGFKHKRPAPISEYERVFQCELNFNAQENQLVLSDLQMMRPVISYDQSVYKQLDRILKDMKANLKKDLKPSENLKQIILSEFMGQTPPIEVMAAFLNLTARSLQRKLAEEKTTYRILTGEIKNELASQWFSKGDVKVSQVSAMLGYSEPSAFRRAYKKWKSGRV